MSPYSARRPRQLVAKAPIRTEGQAKVTLRVPRRLAHRVFLYYGFHEGRDGKPSLSIYDFPGSSTIEFRPCADKPATVWPGGIRTIGRKPVRLMVSVEGRTGQIPLRLGRPAPYRPSD